MKICETLKIIGRDITDEILSRDSNPEHIREFPSHLSACSRTKPLHRRVDWQGHLPSWGNAGLNTEATGVTISCLECGGEQKIKF